MCASAATYLPLACDTIRIHKNADMMLHEPEGGFYGTLDTASADLDYFSTLRDRIIALYASRTGLSPAEVVDILKAAQFLNATRCKELNLVDEIIGGEDETETQTEEQEEVSNEDETKADEGSSDAGSSEDEQEETEDKCKNEKVFSLKNLVKILKANNISFLKAENDEFAEQTEVVNTLTTRVKDLETELEAKQKSYNELLNRLEETTKDMEKKIQLAVANKIAQFGYSDTLPAPSKAQNKRMDEAEFRNAVKEIYATKGYAAAADFVNNYNSGQL